MSWGAARWLRAGGSWARAARRLAGARPALQCVGRWLVGSAWLRLWRGCACALALCPSLAMAALAMGVLALQLLLGTCSAALAGMLERAGWRQQSAGPRLGCGGGRFACLLVCNFGVASLRVGCGTAERGLCSAATCEGSCTFAYVAAYQGSGLRACIDFQSAARLGRLASLRYCSRRATASRKPT